MNYAPIPRQESADNLDKAGTRLEPPVFGVAAEYAAICNAIARMVDKGSPDNRARLAKLARRAANLHVRLYCGDEEAASGLRALADECSA